MGMSFAQLVEHLGQQDKWQGFDACTFEPNHMTVTDALGCLNAWSKGTATIRHDVATRSRDGTLPDAERIQAYADDFRDGPVTLVGFTLQTFGAIWSKEYPGAARDQIVIWDGHHRTAALAIREARGIRDQHPVIVLLGAVP